MEDYKILSANNAKELERIVMKYLSMGYQLAGGHQVTCTDNDVRSNGSGLYFLRPNQWEITQAVYKPAQTIEPIKEKKVI